MWNSAELTSVSTTLDVGLILPKLDDLAMSYCYSHFLQSVLEDKSSLLQNAVQKNSVTVVISNFWYKYCQPLLY